MNRSGRDEVQGTVERVARDSYGRLVAYLSSRTRDVAGDELRLQSAGLVGWSDGACTSKVLAALRTFTRGWRFLLFMQYGPNKRKKIRNDSHHQPLF
jgi:hypothetical protein